MHRHLAAEQVNVRAWMRVALIMALLLQSASSLAWGDRGHRIIGLIAEHYLTAQVRQKIDVLLAMDGSGLADSTSIADEAVWADRYRDADRHGSQIHYHQTQAWHYVDLEIDGPDMAAACPDHACIVDKIEEFKRDLADPTAPPEQRLLALQFLLHLIGDLHQPLHAGEHHDKGGNEVAVKRGAEGAANLHQYWDSAFVARLGPTNEEVARRLIAGISPAEWRTWTAGTVTDWAYESFGIARRDVYGRLPPPDARGLRTLDDDYERNATAIVEVQLQRAGVRLAATLNDALR